MSRAPIVLSWLLLTVACTASLDADEGIDERGSGDPAVDGGLGGDDDDDDGDDGDDEDGDDGDDDGDDGPRRYRAQGYALVWEIDGAAVTGYQQTASSFMRVFSGVLADDPDADDGEVALFELSSDDTVSFERDFLGFVSEDGDQLVLEADDETLIRFDLIENALPPLTEESDDPELSFQVFWELFDEQFVEFPLLPSLDWQAVYDQFRPQVTPDTTEEELFEILAEMLALTLDNHSSIESDDDDFSAGPARSLPSEFLEDEGDTLLDVVATYTEADALVTTGGGQVRYGVIVDGLVGRIGYVAVLAFEDLGDFDDSRDELAFFEAAVDEAMVANGDVDAVIVDLRLNGGGGDHLAMALASRFASDVQVGYTKQARVGEPGEFGTATEVEFGPAGVQALDRDVVVLTSCMTASAAEIAMLAFNELEDVTSIGETTFGIFSNTLGFVLPNGFEGTLSNERYLSADGENFEQRGVPPDVEVITDEDALADGRDNVLEAALDHLASE